MASNQNEMDWQRCGCSEECDLLVASFGELVFHVSGDPIHKGYTLRRGHNDDPLANASGLPSMDTVNRYIRVNYGNYVSHSDRLKIAHVVQRQRAS